MIVTKRSFLRFFFVLEIVVFTALYFFGPASMYVARRLQQEVADLYKQQNSVKQEIEALEDNIRQWQQTDFYTEKYAREQLQMARPSEQLYVITESAPV